MPAGSSPGFQATAYKVEEMLGESKFDEARELLKRLPAESFSLDWDDSGVPVELRARYAMARDGAIADWTKAIPGLQILLKVKGTIKVSFKQTLPPAPDRVIPAGAVFFTSDSAAEPRIEAVIALKRDTQPTLIDPRHVQNEVGYAIGSFLGIANLPRPVGYMGRMDQTSLLQLRVNPREIEVARENLAFVTILKTAVEKKIPLSPTKPQMFIDRSILDGQEVPQDEPMNFSLEVTNRGNATLKLRGFTECGCIHVGAPLSVEPGQSGLIQVTVDTNGLAGPFHKVFVIYSNDPENSEQIVKIKAWVTPRYRLLQESGAGAVVLSEDNLKQNFFFVVDQKRPFNVTGVKVNGIKAIAEFEPWEGTMPDPAIEEPAKPRKGYKLTLLASPTEHIRRSPMTFAISTDSKTMPIIYETMYVQWGISAPADVNFGEIPKAQTGLYFLVSQPGKPFKIRSVESDTDVIKTSVEPMKNGDYRVIVTLLAIVPVGRIDANITIKTDDPKQPVIKVRVLGIVR